MDIIELQHKRHSPYRHIKPHFKFSSIEVSYKPSDRKQIQSLATIIDRHSFNAHLRRFSRLNLATIVQHVNFCGFPARNVIRVPIHGHFDGVMHSLFHDVVQLCPGKISTS